MVSSARHPASRRLSLGKETPLPKLTRPKAPGKGKHPDGPSGKSEKGIPQMKVTKLITVGKGPSSTAFMSVKIGKGIHQREFIINTDKNGRISENTAIGRFLDVGAGDREGRVRNPLIDLGVLADKVVPGLKGKTMTENAKLWSYLWYIYPNEMDIANVDTPESTWAPPEDARKKGATMAVVGEPLEREAIFDTILRNFTKKERRLMRGLIIEVRPSAGRGIAGFYQRGATSTATLLGKGTAQGPTAADRIVIARNYLLVKPDEKGPRKGNTFNDNVVTHELIHYLRARDEERKGLAARAPSGGFMGSDKDLEESFTDLETTNRRRTSPHIDGAGYYRSIRNAPASVGLEPGVSPERSPGAAEDARIHDKMILQGTVDEKGTPLVRGAQMNHEVDVERGQIKTGITKGQRVKSSQDPTRRDGEGRFIGFSTVEARDKAVTKMFKGKKGKVASGKLEGIFPRTALSKAQIRGGKEAIDSYWRSTADREGKKTDLILATHVFSPRANANPQDVIKIITGANPSAKVRQWKDGKLTRSRALKGA